MNGKEESPKSVILPKPIKFNPTRQLDINKLPSVNTLRKVKETSYSIRRIFDPKRTGGSLVKRNLSIQKVNIFNTQQSLEEEHLDLPLFCNNEERDDLEKSNLKDIKRAFKIINIREKMATLNSVETKNKEENNNLPKPDNNGEGNIFVIEQVKNKSPKNLKHTLRRKVRNIQKSDKTKRIAKKDKCCSREKRRLKNKRTFKNFHQKLIELKFYWIKHLTSTPFIFNKRALFVNEDYSFNKFNIFDYSGRRVATDNLELN